MRFIVSARSAVLALAFLMFPAMVGATVWLSENTGLPGAQIDLTVRINTVTEEVEFVVTSANNSVWQGIGFGNSFMTSTYAIIMYPDGTAEERVLGNHAAGSLTTMASLESVTRVDNGGTVTFTITRPATPNLTGVFNFPLDGSPITMIRARGTSPTFSYHGSSNKSFGSIVFEEDPTTGIEDSPEVFATSLHNTPNPFNPSTEFRFFLERPGRVVVQIYDIRGQEVRSIDAGRLGDGPQSIHWNGDDAEGQRPGSGVYFYRLMVNGRPAAGMGQMTMVK